MRRSNKRYTQRKQMQPRLIKTTLGDFVPAKWTGKNESGWQPTGDRVLVLPDQAADIVRGIHLPSDSVGRLTMASEAGCVVALGDGAFAWNGDRISPYKGRHPQPGDRVSVERYAGQLIHGKDGQVYRLMESASIGAMETGNG